MARGFRGKSKKKKKGGTIETKESRKRFEFKQTYRHVFLIVS
jgi:hypothetical protein